MTNNINHFGTYVPIAQRDRIAGMETSLWDGNIKAAILDDNLEGGYLRIYTCQGPVSIQQLCGLTHSIPGVDLIAEVVVNEIATDHGATICLHSISIRPENDFLWPRLIAYLVQYAAKLGYTQVTATGKSNTHSRDAVSGHLLNAGFSQEKPSWFVHVLDGDCA